MFNLEPSSSTLLQTQKKTNGYSLTAGSEANTLPETNDNIAFLTTKGKTDFSLAYNYNYGGMDKQPFFFERQNYQEGKPTDKLTSNGIGNGNVQMHTMRTMMDVNLDSMNSFYFDAHALITRYSNTSNNFRTYHNGTDTEYSSMIQKEKWTSGASEFNLIYQNLYKKNKKERFTTGYRYAYNPDKRHAEANERRYEGEWNEDSEYKEFQSKNTSDGGIHEHTLQLDYTWYIGARHTLKTGLKNILRIANATPQYYIWHSDSQSWEEGMFYENDNVGRMDQIQNVSATYLTYNLQLKRVSLNAGGRMEYAYTNVKFKDTPSNNFKSKLPDFMPKFNLSYTISQQSRIELNYSAGIIRPSISNMNPFKQQTDEYTLLYGNPNLKSEEDHNLELSHSYFNNHLFISSSIKYTHKNKVIVQYPFVDESNPKLLQYTYGNIGKIQKLNGSVYINYKPADAISLSAIGTVTHNILQSHELGIKNHGLGYNAFVSCDFSLPKNWLLGSRWSIFHQDPSFRISENSLHMYSCYLYKRFLNNNLSVGIVANQPFNEFFKSRSTIKGESFIQITNNHMRARSFGVRLSYTIKSGKRINIQRNQNISNKDLLQKTGVQ